jgi:hypothetical protein
MSPEQAACASSTPQRPLLAAVTFHEFLALRHYSPTAPTRSSASSTPSRTSARRLRVDPTTDPQFPPELRYICKRGLEKDRNAQRYSRPAEMIADMRAYIDGKTDVKCMYHRSPSGCSARAAASSTATRTSASPSP